MFSLYVIHLESFSIGIMGSGFLPPRLGALLEVVIGHTFGILLF